jgi:hypothetical protein
MTNWTPAKGSPVSGLRRSQRVILSVPVTVRTAGERQDGSFEEETRTMVVNAHGALIALAGKVEKGQSLQLINRATQAELDCRVIYLGPMSGNKVQVGVEFVKPSSGFWGIAFPPEDWPAPEELPYE